MNEGQTTSHSETTIETRPYLADPQVMEKLLRGVLRESVNCRGAVAQGILTHEDANKIDEKEVTKAAAVLLGRERRYATDTTWNAPGVIDVFVAKELNVQVRGPENILVAALQQFLQEVHQQLDLLNNPTAPPDWEKKVQKTLEKYRDLLLGLPISGAAADQGASDKKAAVPDYLTEAFANPPAQRPAVSPEARKPLPSPQPAAASPATAPVQPVQKSGGLKWAAVAGVVVVVVAGIVFLRKPAAKTETAVTPPAENKTAPAKPVAPATAKSFQLKDGAIVEVDDAGKIVRTIRSTKNANFSRLLDWTRAGKNTSFLVGTQADGQRATGLNAAFVLSLLDDAGHERVVNESVSSAAFSPDGLKLVYVTSDAALEVENVSGEKGFELIGAYGATWNPRSGAILFLKVPDGRPVFPPESLEVASLDAKTQAVQTLSAGTFDAVTPQCDPSGKWVIAVAGSGTGLPSFWRAPLEGGEPAQITNTRLNEGESWVPTTYQTASWSPDSHWFIYDYRDTPIEQIWGLELDDKGSFKRALKIADGLSPRFIDAKRFTYMKRTGDKVEPAVEKIPGT